MTETLAGVLTRLSEVDGAATLWGRQARPFYGPLFDRLLSRGVLVENAPDTTWPVCPDCECGLDERPIEVTGDCHVAICPIDRRADRILEPDDLRSFSIDRDALVREIARASGFGEPSAVTEGLWVLGRLETGRVVFIALSRTTPLREELPARLAEVARGARCIVLGPQLATDAVMRFADRGMDFIPIRMALLGDERRLHLDPAALEPRATLPRLQIDRAARRVSVDGRVVHTSEQQFSLLSLLAESASTSGAPVSNRSIEDHLWGTAVSRVAIQAKEPIRSLRKALGAAIDIQNTRNPNGYRLVLDPSDIVIRD